MNHTTLSPLLTGPQAAIYLGIKPNTLRRWRCSGRGPRYVRLGSSTRSDWLRMGAWSGFVQRRCGRMGGRRSARVQWWLLRLR